MLKISVFLDALRRAGQGGRKREHRDILIELEALLTKHEPTRHEPQYLGILWLALLCYKLEEKDIEFEKDIEKMLEEGNIKSLVKGKFEKLEGEEKWLTEDIDKEYMILGILIHRIMTQKNILEELKILLTERKKPAEGTATLSADDEKVFAMLEEIGRHIYREIDSGNSIRIMRGLDGWISDNYPLIQSGRWQREEENEWYGAYLKEGRLNDSRCIIIPQLGIKIDKKFMNYFFEGYSKNMLLKSTDVVKFARALYDKDKNRFKVVEKGIIRREGAEETIAEERKLLASIADRLKKIKLTKPSRYAISIYNAFGKIQVKGKATEEFSKLSGSISSGISRFAAWAESNVRDSVLLGMARRLLKLERQRVGMRINLLKGAENPSRGPKELGTQVGPESPKGPAIIKEPEPKSIDDEIGDALDDFLRG